MDFKKFLRKAFFPPLWIIVLGTLISTVSLITVFVNGWESCLIAYLVYVVAFYSLTVLVLACYKTIPGYYRDAKKKVYSNPYANRYLTDAAFKTHVNLYRSLAINLLYVVINAVSAFVYRTNWFGIFAVYYAIMAVMRFLLARYAGKNSFGESPMKERIRARACAYILMTVNLALSGVVLMMIYYNRGFEYQGYLIYVMALYTFYITITAIISMIKYRKSESPVITMSTAIKLAASLFSMLFLETAMLSQFGQDTSEATKRILIMATGAGISVVVTAIAVYWIVRWTKEIRELRSKE